MTRGLKLNASVKLRKPRITSMIVIIHGHQTIRLAAMNAAMCHMCRAYSIFMCRRTDSCLRFIARVWRERGGGVNFINIFNCNPAVTGPLHEKIEGRKNLGLFITVRTIQAEHLFCSV